MKAKLVYKGGPGSGFTSEAGHQGIPGQVGGSTSTGNAGRPKLTGLIPKEIEAAERREVSNFESYVKPTTWEKNNLEGDLEYANEELQESMGLQPANYEEVKLYDKFMASDAFKDLVKRQALCNMLVDLTDNQRKALRRGVSFLDIISGKYRG